VLVKNKIANHEDSLLNKSIMVGKYGMLRKGQTFYTTVDVNDMDVTANAKYPAGAHADPVPTPKASGKPKVKVHQPSGSVKDGPSSSSVEPAGKYR